MTDWIDDYVLTARIRLPGQRAAFYRTAARGAFTCVARGAYLPTVLWDSLDVAGRHLARMRAAHLLRDGVVFSHLSAAILWDLPVVGGDLALPHVVCDRATGGRSAMTLHRHAIGMPRETVEVGGLRVTTLPQTAAHLAAGVEAEVSVPVLDAALARGVDRGDVQACLDTDVPGVGAARAAWAVGFADATSGSPGESLSRVAIHHLGLPAPRLQTAVRDGRGLVGIVDFHWPDLGVVGEFDGVGKYLRDAFTAGRAPGEVVVDEKVREDRLRATGLRVARWGWDAARDLGTLRRILSEQGVRAR